MHKETSNLSLKNNVTERLVKVENTTKPSTLTKVEPYTNNNKRSSTTSISSIRFVEDVFGKYVDENGVWHKIMRYTWTNLNKICVQVINYGARIIAIHMPDRKGRLADIVLGFNDIAGYYHYRDYYFGATIGRLANQTENQTFSIDGKQYWLTKSETTLDRVIWTPYINGNQLILSYVSRDGNEGHPGDLLITVKYELSARNEFHVCMEAKSTASTAINLSNLLYFNLAGHQMGPDHIYKHILTLNCNCFTVKREDGLPNGRIMNVANTNFDFQIPKQLGKIIGIVPKDGIDQNLCVNRGTSTVDECLVGRIFHPPSGRMMEIYSNQPGVQLSTANEFGYGRILSLDEILKSNNDFNETKKRTKIDEIIALMKNLHGSMKKVFKEDIENDFRELLALIIKLRSETVGSDLAIQERNIVLTQLQMRYLTCILNTPVDGECDREIVDELQAIVKRILCNAGVKNDFGAIIQTPTTRQDEEQLKTSPIGGNVKNGNFVPRHYTESKRILGKNGAVYKMHSGIALQTQNYPNCANIKHFPNCILRPGEVYKHTVTYKFWIRSGNPNQWIKKNCNQSSNYISTSNDMK